MFSGRGNNDDSNKRVANVDWEAIENTMDEMLKKKLMHLAAKMDVNTLQEEIAYLKRDTKSLRNDVISLNEEIRVLQQALDNLHPVEE